MIEDKQTGVVEATLSNREVKTLPLEAPTTPKILEPSLDPKSKHTWFTGTAQLVGLLLIFGLASGALGALIMTWMLPHPTLPTRIGVISMTRLTQAIGTSTPTLDPTSSTPLAVRVEGAIKRLTDADPTLILFVKEAIIAGGPVEDFTDETLAFFSATTTPAPASSVSFPPGGVAR